MMCGRTCQAQRSSPVFAQRWAKTGELCWAWRVLGTAVPHGGDDHRRHLIQSPGVTQRDVHDVRSLTMGPSELIPRSPK